MNNCTVAGLLVYSPLKISYDVLYGLLALDVLDIGKWLMCPFLA